MEHLIINKDKLYRRALLLAQITVFYNIVEGLVSVFFGAGGESLSLFGFGVDSFVEVISGIGNWFKLNWFLAISTNISSGDSSGPIE